jgi:twitching motility protein PilT
VAVNHFYSAPIVKTNSEQNSIDKILPKEFIGTSGTPVIFKRFGTLLPITKENITADFLRNMISHNVDQKLLIEFEKNGDCEFIHTVEGAGRFRITLLKHRDGWDLTARCIPTEIKTFEEAGLPSSCIDLTKWSQGLVLVTGPACCGKSSTLATLVEAINQTRSDHIITIEDPIENVYQPKMCQITQREVGTHTLSQTNALKSALREDPDIIVVSELRELKSIELAVSAAETGHLVFGTMNTNNATQTVSTLIDSFPPEDKSIMTNMISESLRGVISQQLIPKKDQSGMVAAYEVLLMTTPMANLIREEKTEQLTNAMITGKKAGMIVLDDSLMELVKSGLISGASAYRHAVNPSTFKKYLEQ